MTDKIACVFSRTAVSDMTPYGCHFFSETARANLKCVEHECPSVWRVCPACIERDELRKINYETVKRRIKDPETMELFRMVSVGCSHLCKFHMANGPEAKRSRTIVFPASDDRFSQTSEKIEKALVLHEESLSQKEIKKRRIKELLKSPTAYYLHIIDEVVMCIKEKIFTSEDLVDIFGDNVKNWKKDVGLLSGLTERSRQIIKNANGGRGMPVVKREAAIVIAQMPIAKAQEKIAAIAVANSYRNGRNVLDCVEEFRSGMRNPPSRKDGDGKIFTPEPEIPLEYFYVRGKSGATTRVARKQKKKAQGNFERPVVPTPAKSLVEEAVIIAREVFKLDSKIIVKTPAVIAQEQEEAVLPETIIPVKEEIFDASVIEESLVREVEERQPKSKKELLEELAYAIESNEYYVDISEKANRCIEVGLSVKDILAKTGKSVRWINSILGLMKLSEKSLGLLRSFAEDGNPLFHLACALEFAKLPSEELQIEAIEYCMERGYFKLNQVEGCVYRLLHRKK